MQIEQAYRGEVAFPLADRSTVKPAPVEERLQWGELGKKRVQRLARHKHTPPMLSTGAINGTTTKWCTVRANKIVIQVVFIIYTNQSYASYSIRDSYMFRVRDSYDKTLNCTHSEFVIHAVHRPKYTFPAFPSREVNHWHTIIPCSTCEINRVYMLPAPWFMRNESCVYVARCSVHSA